MSIVDLFERRFSGYKVKRCGGQGRKLNLKEFPDRRMIIGIDRMNLPRAAGKRCDYVIAVDEKGSAFLLPIEFKSKKFKLGEVRKQLEGGIGICKKCLPDRFRCYPVLVSELLTKGRRDELRKIRIKFNGKQATIKHIRYEESLIWDDVRKGAIEFGV